MSDELCFMSAEALAAAYRKRTLSPREVVNAILERIEVVNPRLNAFVTVCGERAKADAEKAERSFMREDAPSLPPLYGIPVTIKDLEDTAGVRTTYGSRHFADHVPDTDAVIWERLKAAGTILIGKTCTPEFGLHSTTDSLLTGTTNNPWDITRSTGGSSGGAGAAVAAGLAPLATGSDGGGSIRVPASLCGIVGLKATPGRIPFNSRNNAFESVTVTGPMTRTVRDSALMLDAVAGPHFYDGVAWPIVENDFYDGLRDVSVTGLRIAFCPDLHSGPVESEIIKIVSGAAREFEAMGARLTEIDLNLPDMYTYFNTWWEPYVALFYHDVLEPLGSPEHIPSQVWGCLEHVKKVELLDYVRHQYHVRSLVRNEFADALAKHDVLIWPTTPCTAFPHPGSNMGPLEIDGQPTRDPMIQNQRFTEAVSHGGFPAISVPAGFNRAGLPVGMQLAALPGAEALLLKVAAAFERAAPWAQYRPPC